MLPKSVSILCTQFTYIVSTVLCMFTFAKFSVLWIHLLRSCVFSFTVNFVHYEFVLCSFTYVLINFYYTLPNMKISHEYTYEPDRMPFWNLTTVQFLTSPLTKHTTSVSFMHALSHNFVKYSNIKEFAKLASLCFHVQIFVCMVLSIFNPLIYCFDLYCIIVHLFRHSRDPKRNTSHD
jgi:hypothetical protein